VINIDWLAFEENYKKKGFENICGVDEAGRGPIAGPVIASAVILEENSKIDGINDSKKLNANKRKKLFEKILLLAKDYSISSASVEEIDKFNILNATLLAMKRAVESLKLKPDIVLIDGNASPKLKFKTKTIIKGDSLSTSIAAASILAKVYRDNLMIKADALYPIYKFSKHKGYGTKLHRNILKKHGTCPIHRKSFKIKNF
jgi:ribonuclease HII